MTKKFIFAVILITLGIISALLIVFSYGTSGGNVGVLLAFLFASILLIIVGSILAFSRLLDRTVTPLVDEINSDIADDLRDLKEHRLTNTHWMVLVTALVVILFSYFVFRFHKVEATWGGIPVVIPTFLAMLALGWFIPRTSWFRLSQDRTPMWIFFIPTIGLVISLWLGLAQTENMSVLSTSPTKTVSYNTVQTTGFFLNTVGNAGELGFLDGLSDCDGDVCGVILLVVLLVILTFVLVLGSAYIPHFWILSGSILLGIMLLIAIHDLRLRPHQKRSPADA
jgi:hypothetical protein